MRPWERWIAVLLVISVVGTILWFIQYEPEVAEESIRSAQGTVVDRAISDGVPYITVEIADGDAVCCWEIYRNAAIPEGIGIGDMVSITYGIELDRGRFAVLSLKTAD